MQRHTTVHVEMACTVLVGGEGDHILAKGTPAGAYQCKQRRQGAKDGVVPHYGFLAVRAPGTSIQHQLQLAGCRAVATGTLQAYTSSFNCQVAAK